MRALALFIAAFSGLAAAAIAPARHFDGLGEMQLVWADEFDADSLDRSVWNVEVNGDGNGNNELQYYVDNGRTVRVDGGNLVITALREPYSGRDFTSGRVNTLGKKTFTYGIVEAAIRLPKTADGLWPAFWMMGNDIVETGWPRCGETDILEMGHQDGIRAGRQQHVFNGALHYGDGFHRQHVGASDCPVSLQDGEYHRYYLVWTPRAISMYVDDIPEPYLSVDISVSATPSDLGYYFHKPAFILLNLAVGGDFPGIHKAADITAIPEGGASMYVDYIRVFQPINLSAK